MAGTVNQVAPRPKSQKYARYGYVVSAFGLSLPAVTPPARYHTAKTRTHRGLDAPIAAQQMGAGKADTLLASGPYEVVQ
jgi:hypothetical protein